MSENRTTDAPRDPAFAAVARVLDAEKAFTAAVALTRIMHEVRRFCAFGEQARADDPTGWIVCETTHCATTRR
jgi:hypothetical protein